MVFKLPRMFNCYEASKLASRRRSAGRQGVYDRLTLGAHLLMCSACRIMERHFDLIDRVARRMGTLKSPGGKDDAPAEGLSQEMKNKLRQAIR